jgi:hypothetical protein
MLLVHMKRSDIEHDSCGVIGSTEIIMEQWERDLFCVLNNVFVFILRLLRALLLVTCFLVKLYVDFVKSVAIGWIDILSYAQFVTPQPIGWLAS